MISTSVLTEQGCKKRISAPTSESRGAESHSGITRRDLSLEQQQQRQSQQSPALPALAFFSIDVLL